MIATAIRTAFERAERQNWWKLYIAVDIHGAIFPSTENKNEQRIFFPGALPALQYLSGRKDVDLMFFTCSHEEEITEVVSLLNRNGVKIAFINQNPEVINDARGDYRFKPYYNILIDDKAGFEPKEWKDVLEVFREFPEMDQPLTQIINYAIVYAVMTNIVTQPGEIIITLESEERRYTYEQLGVGYDSSDDAIVAAVGPMLTEDVGMNLESEFRNGGWTIKKVDSSQNTYIFPKSTAGAL